MKKKTSDGVRELASRIYQKRFFLEKVAVFEHDLEDRVIFLYPVEDPAAGPKQTGRVASLCYVAVLDSFKVCLLEMRETAEGRIHLHTPIFSVDIRVFLADDISTIKISNFWGLHVEAHGQSANLFLYLDVSYYSLTGGDGRETGDESHGTVSLPLRELFAAKALFERQNRPDARGEGPDGGEILPRMANVLEFQNVRHVNIGVPESRYKTVGVRCGDFDNTIVLNHWNPHLPPEEIALPDAGNHKILAVFADAENIFVSCENERIFRFAYGGKKRPEEFAIGDNLFARSLVRIGANLYAAVTNRAVLRIPVDRPWRHEVKAAPLRGEYQILDSAPVFLAPFGTNRLLVSTKHKQLQVFNLNDAARDDELEIYETFRREFASPQALREFCLKVLQRESFAESELATLEFAAYSWRVCQPDDLSTPLQALVYHVNRGFGGKPDKGDIVLRFIQRHETQIFADFARFSLLFKEFYITSCDKYRADILLRLQRYFPHIRNELDYLGWNGGAQEEGGAAESWLNRFGLLFFYHDGLFLKYVTPLPHPPGAAEKTAENQVISYLHAADTVAESQRVAVVDSEGNSLYLLDRGFFKRDGLREEPIALGDKARIRKIRCLGSRRLLVYSDESNTLKMLVPDKGDPPGRWRSKTSEELPGITWDIDLLPFSRDGRDYGILAVGFKNAGCKLYLLDADRPEYLRELYTMPLVHDWIRDLDLLWVDPAKLTFAFAAVGSKFKKLYSATLRLKEDLYTCEPEIPCRHKKFSCSPFCVRFFNDPQAGRCIVVGSDQGDLYFCDENLNIHWQRKLAESIRTIKIFPCAGRSDIVVAVGNGDIVFFSKTGWVERDIHFDRPQFCIDTTLLHLPKRDPHLLAGIGNRLLVFEENHRRFLELLAGEGQGEVTDGDVERLLGEAGEQLVAGSLSPLSPVFPMLQSLQAFHRWKTMAGAERCFTADPESLLRFYHRDKERFLRALGGLVETVDIRSTPALEQMVLHIADHVADEDVLWHVLRFLQRKYPSPVGLDLLSFLDQLEALLKEPGGVQVRLVFTASPWLLESVAVLIADVLHVEEKNVVSIIHELLCRAMPHQIYSTLADCFNQSWALETLFSLHGEVNKAPFNFFAGKFAAFIDRLHQYEERLLQAGVNYVGEVGRLYRWFLRAAQCQTVGDIRRAQEEDIRQTVHLLQKNGFSFRDTFLELVENLYGIDLQSLEPIRYNTQKTGKLQHILQSLQTILIESRRAEHLGNKMVNIVAFQWKTILERVRSEFKNQVRLELLTKRDLEDDVHINLRSLEFENCGGAAIGTIHFTAHCPDLEPVAGGVVEAALPPGPGHTSLVPLLRLLRNPCGRSGTFQVEVRVEYQCGGRQFYEEFPIRLTLSVAFEVEKRDTWAVLLRENPEVFDYRHCYPHKYREVADTINRLLEDGGGVLVLQGEKGVGRSSLLRQLSLFLDAPRSPEAFYIPIERAVNPNHRREQFLQHVLQQLLNTIDGGRTPGSTTSCLEHIRSRLREFPRGSVLLFNKFDGLSKEVFVELFALFTAIAENGNTVVTAAVDRKLVRTLHKLGKSFSTCTISSIPEEDQVNRFYIELGEDYADILPTNWRLLVGSHVFSTFLLVRFLRQRNAGEPVTLEECVEGMWVAYEREKKHRGFDYYRNVWETLSLKEKLILYICAREDMEIALGDLEPGMIVGNDPYLRKKYNPAYKIQVKVKRDGQVVHTYYLEEDRILDRDGVDYLQRAQERLTLSNTGKGRFPVKLLHPSAMLDRSRPSRVVLANYLMESGALDGKLQDLCSLGLLREIVLHGTAHYCHSDYFFMLYLLQTFADYHRLAPIRELVSGYSLAAIHCACESQFDDSEKIRFRDFLQLDAERLQQILALAVLWARADMDHLFDFLRGLFYLAEVPGFPGIDRLPHFTRGLFQFKLPVLQGFPNLLLIVLPQEVDTAHLDLGGALEYYHVNAANTLVFVVTFFDRLRFPQYIVRAGFNVVVLDEHSLVRYIQAEKRELELLDQIAHYLDLNILSPYRYAKGISGDLFVGRRVELVRILQNADKDFTIFGARRIGKTSLFNQIQYQCSLRADSDIHPVLLDLLAVSRVSVFFRILTATLRADPVFTRFMGRDISDAIQFEQTVNQVLTAHPRLRLIFLVDEIDAIYSHNCFAVCDTCGAYLLITLDNYSRLHRGVPCRWCGYTTVVQNFPEYADVQAVHELFARFRSLSQTQKRCQFVFAGFKTLFFLQHHEESELFNFTVPLYLSNLDDPADLYNLVIEPMRRLRIAFQDEKEILQELWRISLNGIPWMVQFCCSQIIERLTQSPQPEINLPLLREITPHLQHEIHENLRITLRTSRELALWGLIKEYFRTFGSMDFSVDDLDLLQRELPDPPAPPFHKEELRFYLELLSHCSFIHKHAEMKRSDTHLTDYFKLLLNPSEYPIWGD